MPVSGPVPVVGRDDKGFWTVTTDAAVTPWQIEDGSGNPVEATGDEQVELFRSVKAGNGRVEIALTDGGTLSAAQVNDLSVAGTANCYVVSAPGTYVFNARVRGNGAGEGVGFEPAIEMADGMTADGCGPTPKDSFRESPSTRPPAIFSSRSAKAGATRWSP